MALITCPHCGKQVSDSVDTCIHCGGSLKGETVPEKGREYAALTLEEQKSLKTEFDTKFPEIPKTERKGNKNAILYCVSFVAFLVGAVMVWVLGEMFDSIAGTVIGAVIAFSGWFGIWITYFYAKAWNKKRLACLKRFQKWLEREKRVHYTVILEEKDRKIFNQTTVD